MHINPNQHIKGVKQRLIKLIIRAIWDVKLVLCYHVVRQTLFEREFGVQLHQWLRVQGWNVREWK